MRKNELQIFNNEDFGQIRTVVINNEPYFVGKDVARALGYKDTSDALKKHVDIEDKLTRRFADTGQNREMYIVNESGLYALTFSSKLESAKKFKRWVTAEVLPSIRRTGSYEMPKTETSAKKKNLSSVNMAAKIMLGIYKEAGVDPLYIAVAVDNLYKNEAGVDFGVQLTTKESKLYDYTEMAKELGVMSKSGNPHDKALSAVIQKLNISEDETVKTPYERNGHSGVTIQYKETVLEKVKKWLSDNDYPTEIAYLLSNGKVNACKVLYRCVEVA